MMSEQTKTFWLMIQRAVEYFPKNYIVKCRFKITMCSNSIILVPTKKGVHFMAVDPSCDPYSDSRFLENKFITNEQELIDNIKTYFTY